MTSVTYIHSVLDKDDWNFQDIKKFLKGNSSSVNEVNGQRETPLLRMLQKRNCTAEDIKLLLKFGSDVNFKDLKGRNSLNMALEFSANADIIKLLLEKGVNDSPHSSSLCLALHCGASKRVIELLLDAGCSTSACVRHASLLHCALDFPKSDLEQDVFQLLIDRGADVRAVTPGVGSILCYALQNGNEASTIQLLMNAGASLNACRSHTSPLYCATDRVKLGAPLKAEVVRLLIKSGASLECLPHAFTPLKCALQLCNYETEAIKLLLDCYPDIDPNDSSMYLRAAMYGAHGNPTVVKLLVKHGVGVNGGNHKGETALHLALGNIECRPSVIKALLDNGADVNQESVYGETPLLVALKYNREAVIIKELLSAGAFIKFCMCHHLMGRLFQPETSVSLKVLLQYFFLQISLFNIECEFQHGRNSAALLKFKDECRQELLKMKFEKIGEEFTLHEFISEYACPREDSIACALPGKKYNFDLLLKTIRGNTYPLYFNIISAKVGTPAMNKMLEEVKVYTYSLDKHSEEKKIVLNYESVCNIARLSAGDDVLRFIIAFYNPRSRCIGQASNEKNNIYMKKEEYLSQCCKRPKMPHYVHNKFKAQQG